MLVDLKARLPDILSRHIHEDAGVDMIEMEAGVRVAVNAAIARSGKVIVVDLMN
jgi:hypothetical protein